MKTPWYFLRFLPIARGVLAGGRLPLLLAAVMRKGRSGGAARLKDELSLFTALCRAYWRGDYRAINGKALIAIVAGLIYFVTPVDLVPDWIPGLGLLDDLAVLGWVMRAWSGEIDKFRAWRSQQPISTQTALEKPVEGERQ